MTIEQRADHGLECPLRYREYGSDTACECEPAEVWCDECDQPVAGESAKCEAHR